MKFVFSFVLTMTKKDVNSKHSDNYQAYFEIKSIVNWSLILNLMRNYFS